MEEKKSICERKRIDEQTKKELAQKLYEVVIEQETSVLNALEALEYTKNKILFNTIV